MVMQMRFYFYLEVWKDYGQFLKIEVLQFVEKMKLNGLKKELSVIVFNRFYKVFFLLILISNLGFAIEPED